MSQFGDISVKSIFNLVAEDVGKFFNKCGKVPILSTLSGAVRISANLVRSVASVAAGVGALAAMGITKIGFLAGSTNCEQAFSRSKTFGGGCVHQFKKGIQGVGKGAIEVVPFGVIVKEKVQDVFQERFGPSIEELENRLRDSNEAIKNFESVLQNEDTSSSYPALFSTKKCKDSLAKEIQNRDKLQDKLYQLKLKKLNSEMAKLNSKIAWNKDLLEPNTLKNMFMANAKGPTEEGLKILEEKLKTLEEQKKALEMQIKK